MASSARFCLNSDDLKKALKAVVYSAISSGLAALTVLFAQPQVPTGKALAAAVLVPAINGGLVVLKKLLEDDGSLSWKSALKD